VLEPDAYNASQAPADLPPPQETALQPGSTDCAISAKAADARAYAPNPTIRKQAARMRIERADSVTSVKLRRSRDKDHLGFVAHQPCTVCGRQPCEAHHLRFSQPRALGRRVSDEFTVPLCRVHHRELHRQGDERAWWNKANIDPIPIALRFWQETRGVLPAGGTNHKPQDSKADVSIEEPSGTGAASNGNLPSRLCVDGSTR
jgi:hypothetical protein